jgi:hypothetical protein
MNELSSLLRQAYELIRDADTTDIDAYYLAVEEAQGFIAEALDLSDSLDLVQENKALRRQLISVCNELMERRR